MKKMFSEVQENHESIKTEVAEICTDHDMIWTDDLAIGGLYAINKATLEVKNVLSPLQMFKYGIFRIKSIVKWKNNIIIVPFEINEKWILYNKVSKEVCYKNVIKEKQKITTSGVYVIDDYAIILPVSTSDPIIFVNLKKMECFRIVEEWGKDIVLKSNRMFEIWHGAMVGGNAFFTLRESRFIIKVNIDKIEKYELELPDGICSSSLCKDKVWVLPMNGKYIYAMDSKGKIVDVIELVVKGRLICATNFIEIVATSRFIFLLPMHNEEICVYDQEKNVFLLLGGKEVKLKNVFLAPYPTTPYWGYYIDGNKICFMPMENTFLTIDLDTLKWERKDILLPSNIMGRDLAYWYSWIQLLRGNIENEKTPDMLGMYLDIISNIDTRSMLRDEKETIGKKICREICR